MVDREEYKLRSFKKDTEMSPKTVGTRHLLFYDMFVENESYIYGLGLTGKTKGRHTEKDDAKL